MKRFFNGTALVEKRDRRDKKKGREFLVRSSHPGVVVLSV